MQLLHFIMHFFKMFANSKNVCICAQYFVILQRKIVTSVYWLLSLYLLSDKNGMTIYHGSLNEITTPIFGQHNDYGQGFYCTENLELAKEWACAVGNNGFVNKYELDIKGLSVLYLNDKQYHILNWMSILLENRTFNIAEGISSRAKQNILDDFLPDYTAVHFNGTVVFSHIFSYQL